ncbi:MAG: hypothetical protein UT78_C0012G0019, partial [Candidatus Nomurabacteria bacterium GW2011_GWF2_40_12]
LVLFAPFGVSVVLALVGAFYFNVFWEAIVWLSLSNLLYGAGDPSAIFISLLIYTIILIAIEMLKKKIKFYDTENYKK